MLGTTSWASRVSQVGVFCGAAPGVWGLGLLLLLLNWEGEPPGEAGKSCVLSWAQIRGRMCEKINANGINGGVKRIVQVLDLLRCSKNIFCAKRPGGGESFLGKTPESPKQR